MMRHSVSKTFSDNNYDLLVGLPFAIGSVCSISSMIMLTLP
jgi:hypothetical protein